MERKAVNSHHEINWSTSDKANCESFISGKGLPRSNQIARFEYNHPPGVNPTQFSVSGVITFSQI